MTGLRGHPRLTMAAGALLASLMTATGAAAQSYPSGPVKVIVPFGAGGATDILARIFSERLQQGLGQSFTVENRGGAAGQIAAAAVARMPTDGSTAHVHDRGADHHRAADERQDQLRPAQGHRADRHRRGAADLARGQRGVAAQVRGRHRAEGEGNARQAHLRHLGRRHRTASRRPRRCRARPASRWCTCRSAAAATSSPR